LHLVRDADGARAALAAAEPGAPPSRPVAARPHVLFLDLPPLAGHQEDARPLLAATASPWLGPLEIYAGAEASTATLRGVATAPACMGVLTAPLAAGVCGRWDRAAVIVAHLPGAALSSVSETALLAGANMFAVRDGDGAWEIVQARDITLVAPDMFEMRMLLRGLHGTEHAAVIAAGAPIVRFDDALAQGALARLDLHPHERGAALALIVPPAERALDDPDAATLVATYEDVWARPFAPVHLRGRRDASGDVTISWNRRSRLEADSWQGEPPSGEAGEDWRVTIRDGSGAILRVLTAATTAVLYPEADQITDFGAPPAELAVTVTQISARFGAGRGRDSLLRL
jgi:hypothetical protein